MALIPVANAALVIGSDWRGVPQSYGDEILYYNQIHEIADGHFWYGNQYLIERAGGPPVLIFGGHWLAAIPLLLGIPFVPAMLLNFILWSVVFAALAYWLLRELYVPKLYAAAGSFAAFLTCYGLIFRPSSRQEVYPVFLLLYIALARFLKKPESRSSIIFLGIATGATFYVFSYLWQTAVITLGLLFIYAVAQKEWPLMRATLKASALGGLIGLPQLLYMFWLSRAYPYFLESVSRFGLVDTHIPMAEIVYSGGWIGILVLLIAFVYWRVPALRREPHFMLISLFAGVSGLGLWIMQGSNLVTGKLLETGEHIRPFIGPWLLLAGVPIAWLLWQKRALMRRALRVVALAACGLILVGVFVFVKQYFYYFIDVTPNAALWKEEQGYAAPLQWIDAQQLRPVVIWSASDSPLDVYTPTLSRDYVLFATAVIFTLVPNDELHERYLVSRYFDNPTVENLKDDLPNYVGRQDAYHHAKTIERGIKLCRILQFWNGGENCGTPPTPQELMGESFFTGLERKFTQDIRPHIRTYMQKYHVAYIIKDRVLHPEWKPETVDAVKVWSDTRYDVYRVPQP